MLLTLTTTHRPATDLGFLLRKNPARPQRFTLSFGEAHVFYPEATDERCTAALLVEVDPVGLVRGREGTRGGGLLDQYVNDRPYAASSFLSVALAEVFGSALSGRAKERPDLVETPLPLVAELACLPCAAGEEWLRRLFEPLGYAVTATRLPLDPRFPAWGESAYHRVTLAATLPLHRLLSHLYVLLPVLDNRKHYFVGDDEVGKLLRHGEGWLSTHPERDAISARYLKYRRNLVTDALAQLAEADDRVPEDEVAGESSDVADASVEEPEPKLSLHAQRLGAVLAALKACGASSVLDLGCGEGRLLRLLLGEKQFTRIVGLDVSHRALEIASDRLRLDRLPPLVRDRLTLLHGSLTYRDARLAGFDAAAVVEVIEHLDPARLGAFERVLFREAGPGTVVLTTPNRDYNIRWETLPAGTMRHGDHRFEWSRAEFAAWCERIAAAHGYTARLLPVGPVDAEVGAPSQMVVFSRCN